MQLAASNSEQNQQTVSFKKFNIPKNIFISIVRGRRMINAYKTNILIPGPDGPMHSSNIGPTRQS